PCYSSYTRVHPRELDSFPTRRSSDLSSRQQERLEPPPSSAADSPRESRMPFLAAVVILFVILLFSAFNVLNEYERAVVFTLGRFTGIKGPGLVLIWPVIQRMRRVDLRVIVLNVPKQDVITRDNVSVKVN